MMKLEEIIREAGLSPVDYPNASQIPVRLYDRKDREVTSQTLSFIEPLFWHNPVAKAEFEKFIKVLDEAPFETESISVRIDEYNVILHYRTANVKIFFRRPTLHPLDYMN